MSDPSSPASPRIEETDGRPIWQRLSIVWIVPLAALIVALIVAFRTYSERGPLLLVRFENASGVVAGETPVRYRDVTIGMVEDVGFSGNLSEVQVSIRLDQDIAEHVTADSQFWIVRPEITAQGITGLSTVIGGSYIAAQLPAQPGETARLIDGLPRAPLTPLDAPGLRLTLRTERNSSVALGSPVLYKGIEVGQVEDLQLSSNGRTIIYTAFVREPYSNLITEGTRFWDSSGFSFNLDAGGASLDVDSITTLLRGGVTFDTVFEGGALVQDERGFRLYPDVAAARSSLFDALERSPVTVSAVFPGSVSGLQVGAPVLYRGVPVGAVTSLSARLQGDVGERTVELVAAFEVIPGRLGLPPDAAQDVTLQLLDELIAEGGLRARLSSPSLLTGAQRIELAEIGEEDTARLDRNIQPFPGIPTVETEQGGLAETAEGLITRLDELPIEGVLTAATSALTAVASLLNDPELRDIPTQANGTLSDLRGLLQSDGVQQAPGEVLASLTALRGLLEDAREAALVEALATTLADISTLAGEVEGATAELTPDLDALLVSARDLATAGQTLLTDPATLEVPDRLAGLLADARAITSDPALREVPPALANTLQRVESLLADVQQAGLPDRIGTAVDQGGAAAEGIASLARDADALPETLQALVAEIDVLVAAAQDIVAAPATQALPEELSRLVTATRTLMEGEALQAIPAELLTGLTSLRRTLLSIEQADIPGQLASALENADRAAASLAELTEDAAPLPGQIGTLVDNADALVADPALQGAASEAQATLAALRELLQDPETTALPGTINRSLTSARVLLDDLAQAELGTALRAALQDAAAAARSVSEASEGLPPLIDRLNAVAAQAEAVNLDQLAKQAEALLASADVLVSSPDTQAIPANLNAALDGVARTLTDLQDAQVAQGLGTSLGAAERAANAITLAATDVPALIARLDALVTQSDLTLQAYGTGSEINEEGLRMIREFRDTARAVTALVRQIERNPNSLILGR
ncbi:MlaD family protein [Roseobacter sp. HKCCA0434]|uniref:MlaD family protein n=1 Tax=Roseobacter sp. HKCCA0434 TaxID=3079297 RepID=UPI002905DACF|nr:MlaD family protein [Roseobacter sp. HKCCA0434]